MLTISQLASYAGVTVRAVRHYHRIGLLAEPERDHSGYRSYDAAAAVRLIRIRALADAGVPLARVQELLVAGPEDFARAVEEIDKALRADIRRLQSNRKRIAELAAGDHLALPQIVLDYLDRLRGLGVGEAYVELERDAWIMLAAQVPCSIDAVVAEKNRQLDEDPDMTRLYHLLGSAPDWSPDDPRVVELADVVEHLRIRAVQSGAVEIGGADRTDPLAALLDAAMTESAPVARRLLAILEQRGWRGWTRLERVPEGRIPRDRYAPPRAQPHPPPARRPLVLSTATEAAASPTTATSPPSSAATGPTNGWTCSPGAVEASGTALTFGHGAPASGPYPRQLGQELTRPPAPVDAVRNHARR